jgi:hypothetical protein
MKDRAHTAVEAPLSTLVPSQAQAPPPSPPHLSNHPTTPPTQAVVPQGEESSQGSADSDSVAVVGLMRAIEALTTIGDYLSLTA